MTMPLRDTLEHTYYLHVVEYRSSEPPREPCMRVDVIQTPEGLFDQTTLADARLGREEWLIVEPHGYGWEVHDQSSDGSTVWRRRHYAYEQRSQHDPLLALSHKDNKRDDNDGDQSDRNDSDLD